MRFAWLFFALVWALVWLASPVFAQSRTEAAGLRFTVPADWTRVPVPSDVRAAQFRVPKHAGDAEDGEAVLFYFGKGQGGGAQENLERWYSQMTQPDGRDAKQAGVVTIRTVHGLTVTALDLPGTYKPMAAAGHGEESTPRPGYRMLAAVIEGNGGTWFLRVIGPDATVKAAKPAFDALLAGVEAHQ